MANIFYVDYYIPQDKVTVEELLSSCKQLVIPEGYDSLESYSADFKEQSGLEYISIGNKGDIISIYYDQLIRFFKKTNINPVDIAYIITTDPQNATLSNEVSVPHYIQYQFGMKNASVFTLQQQCASTLVVCGLAKNLLNRKKKYLIVLSSCFVPTVDNRCMPFSIVGDGVGFMVLSYENEGQVIEGASSVSDGQYSYNSVSNIKNDISRLAVVERGAKLICDLLEEHKISIDSVNALIPQSVNKSIYSNVYSRLLNIDPDKIFLSNIQDGGHIGDVDIIRNYKDYLKKKNCDSEKPYTLLYGLGTNGTDINYNAVLVCQKKQK